MAAKYLFLHTHVSVTDRQTYVRLRRTAILLDGDGDYRGLLEALLGFCRWAPTSLSWS